MCFTSKPEILRIGEALGDIDDRVVKEQQIRKTIEEHLNKELLLNSSGHQGAFPLFHRPGGKLPVLR